jgi:flavin-dependent dehydrogenase
MTQDIKPAYDCIVVGGGPAGATAAALVAEAGFSALLLEREQFPRFHIGESLMPETYWTLKRLGVLEQMKASHFPRKFSVQFVSHSGKESAPFYFQDFDPRECSQTWQVLRSEFDAMLFENARSKGADCHDNTRVLEVLFEGCAARGVVVQARGHEPRKIASRVVIDASGQHSLIANQLRLREENLKLRKAAIWAYYQGAQRDKGLDEGATIILHTREKRSWFWYIPLPEDTVSVGVVGDSQYLLRGRGTPEAVFEEELCLCPAVVQRLMNATLVSPFRVMREFSYTTRQPAGEGWVLAGDAFGFLDPIYSSGVFLALKSGELAADAVIEGLRTNNLSAAQLGTWCDDFFRGMDRIRKLVYAFYTDAFSFGQFMRSFPHHKRNLTDLLVGKVFHESAGDIFRDMDPWLEEAMARSATHGAGSDDAEPTPPQPAVRT